jgi:4-amino-4-deoxy-L-arabinose transferase-like glycosyltransferase
MKISPKTEKKAASPSIRRPSQAQRGLWMILFVAVALRFFGITWSLPNSEHLFSFHPDELLVIQASRAAAIWVGEFNPHFYNYGSLTIYLNSFFRPLAYLLLTPSLYADYLMGRFITMLFGVGTVYLVYLAGKRIAGERAGLLAAGTSTVM